MEQQKQTPRWQPGDKLIRFVDAARDKFGHHPNWLWRKVKNPEFVQVFYVEGMPHFIEREIDEYFIRLGERMAA